MNAKWSLAKTSTFIIATCGGFWLIVLFVALNF